MKKLNLSKIIFLFSFVFLLSLTVLFVKIPKASAAVPTVAVSAETNVDSISTTLNGTVNPNSLATDAWYLWGTSSVGCSALPNATDIQSLGSGASPVALTAALSGFVPGVTYYYCAVAVNSSGVTYGTVSSFVQESASGCQSVSLTSDYTVSSSCVFGNSTNDGVDKGTGTQNDGVLTVAKGTTLTVGANQTIAYGTIYMPGATVVRLSGGSLRRGPVWVADADTDGYPDNVGTQGQIVSATQPAGYSRRAVISTATLDCDSSDAAKFKNYVSYTDVDGDGYATTVTQQLLCSGSTLTGGTVSSSGVDCNDASALVQTNVADLTTDADTDGYYTGSASTQCVGTATSTISGRTYYRTSSGTYDRILSTPTGGANAISSTADCSDANVNIYQNVSVATDVDQDGYSTAVAGSVCVGASSTVSERTYYVGSTGAVTQIAAASILATSDCNDSDATKYQNLSASVDGDGDGFPGGTQSDVCSGATLPAGYSSAAGAIAISQKGNCVIVADGTVQCWGSNSSGQLGITADSVKRPNAVTVAGISGATAVASSDSSSCALISDGTIKCWGSGTAGQLGNGDTASSATPVTVIGITTATQISGGSQYYCARLSDGSAKCWGNNDQGRLADGTTTASSTPVTTLFSNVTQIESGFGHTCARISDGTVQCIGYNYYGQLGTATNLGTFTPILTPTTVSGISGATKIENYGIGNCALSSGSIKCWGYGDRGTLGNGVFSNSHTPVSVSNISTATDIMNNSTYVMCAILSGGGNNVRCWGYNGTGGVGSGTVGTDVSTPQTVSGVTASLMGGGRGNNCVVSTTGGALKCWGGNSNGESGIAITTNTGSTTVSTHVSSFGLDCNDSDNTKWRNVLATSNTTDADGDGWVVGAITSQCIGDLGSLTLSGTGSDCYDGNASANPFQASYFTTHRGDGSFDYNCDGTQPVRYPITTLSASSCSTSIPTGIMGPTSSIACGGNITQVTSCFGCNSTTNCTNGTGSCSTTGSNLWTGTCTAALGTIMSGYVTVENIATRLQECR